MLGKIYFPGNDRYENILVFVSMLNSLILDSIREVTNLIPTAMSSEKIKPFDNDLEPTV